MQKQNTERNEELYRAFKKAYSSPHVNNFQQAIREAVNSPCSQFYVSAEEAYRFIRKKQQTPSVPILKWRWGGDIHPSKLRALRLIYRRFTELQQSHFFKGYSTFFVASFACTSPAPCFFLSYRRAYEIIRQMRKHGHVSPHRHPSPPPIVFGGSPAE